MEGRSHTCICRCCLYNNDEQTETQLQEVHVVDITIRILTEILPHYDMLVLKLLLITIYERYDMFLYSHMDVCVQESSSSSAVSSLINQT